MLPGSGACPKTTCATGPREPGRARTQVASICRHIGATRTPPGNGLQPHRACTGFPDGPLAQRLAQEELEGIPDNRPQDATDDESGDPAGLDVVEGLIEAGAESVLDRLAIPADLLRAGRWNEGQNELLGVVRACRQRRSGPRGRTAAPPRRSRRRSRPRRTRGCAVQGSAIFVWPKWIAPSASSTTIRIAAAAPSAPSTKTACRGSCEHRLSQPAARARARARRAAPRGRNDERKPARDRALERADERRRGARAAASPTSPRDRRTASERSGTSPSCAFSSASRRSRAIGTFFVSDTLPSRITFVPPSSACSPAVLERRSSASGAMSASASTRPAWRAPIVIVPLARGRVAPDREPPG